MALKPQKRLGASFYAEEKSHEQSFDEQGDKYSALHENPISDFSSSIWVDSLEQTTKLLNEFTESLQTQTIPTPFSSSLLSPQLVGETFLKGSQSLASNPSNFFATSQEFWQSSMTLWTSTLERVSNASKPELIMAEPSKNDKRFQADAWKEHPYYDFIKQSYLLMVQSINQTIEALPDLDSHTKAKLTFYSKQILDALSPTNFPHTNPVVLNRTLETQGKNLVDGLQNFLEDFDPKRCKLDMRMGNNKAFTVGENIAATPGKVVYQTKIMELIQYSPQTETVFEIPLLIIPSWFNKFYIFDLSTHNSFVNWAVQQGFTVFIISWANPTLEQAETCFTDYLQEGLLKAMDAVEKITGAQSTHLMGYCLGGILLTTLLGYLRPEETERIASASLLAMIADFAKAGDMRVFMDEAQFDHISSRLQKTGILDGFLMKSTFSSLRANDFVWSTFIKKYMLGEPSPALDFLYWNDDFTNMPAAMHKFLLKNMYLQNLLIKPNKLKIGDRGINLHNVKVPSFIFSTKDDHIAPWHSSYPLYQLFKGSTRYVLGGAGHVAGVMNPVGSPKYGYWTNSTCPSTPEEWLETATQHQGSWWTEWSQWVQNYSGNKVPARKISPKKYNYFQDAPGIYVRERA